MATLDSPRPCWVWELMVSSEKVTAHAPSQNVHMYSISPGTQCVGWLLSEQHPECDLVLFESHSQCGVVVVRVARRRRGSRRWVGVNVADGGGGGLLQHSKYTTISMVYGTSYT